MIALIVFDSALFIVCIFVLIIDYRMANEWYSYYEKKYSLNDIDAMRRFYEDLDKGIAYQTIYGKPKKEKPIVISHRRKRPYVDVHKRISWTKRRR